MRVYNMLNDRELSKGAADDGLGYRPAVLVDKTFHQQRIATCKLYRESLQISLVIPGFMMDVRKGLG